MKTEKLYCLEADTINGVTASDRAEECSDPLTDSLFYEMLKDLGDGETICGEVTQEWYDRIKKEYGVN